MNKSSTIELLEKYYSNIEYTTTDVVRAERKFNESIIAVSYFDFTDSLSNPTFNISSYVQKTIATDFYKNEGSLQWNYYLYFVLESAAFQRIRAKGVVDRIEKDRAFARKFVREQKILNHELALPVLNALKPGGSVRDLASKWTEELAEASLGAIAEGNEAYTRVIDNYLSAETSKTRQKRVSEPRTSSVANGKFITALKLDTYRVHPAQRAFEFGTVNLFRGVNGAGKTSLLEAIELCICGANRRNADAKEIGSKIEITFDGSSIPDICPKGPPNLYRERDGAWYGGYYRHGNRLYDNFGRFNFFNSDAGFELTLAKDSDSVENAVQAMVLGEYANGIQERMQKCQTKFLEITRDNARRKSAFEKELKSAVEGLNQLKKVKDTREALTSELRQKAKDCGWRRLPSQVDFEKLTVLRETVAEIEAGGESDLKRLSWLSEASISFLRRAEKNITEQLRRFHLLTKQDQSASTELEDLKKQLDGNKVRVQILARLTQYASDSSAQTLIGLRERRSSCQTRLTQLTECARLLQGIDINNYGDIAGTFTQIISALKVEVAQRKKSTQKEQERMASLQEQLGELRSLVQDIRASGRHFCAIAPGAAECPLCGSTDDNKTLLARITSLKIGTELEQLLRELKSKITHDSGELLKLETRLTHYLRIQEASILIFEAESLLETRASELIRKLGAIPSDLEKEKSSFDSMTIKEKELRLKGFTQNEYEKILEDGKRLLKTGVPKLIQVAEVKKLFTSARALDVESAKQIILVERKREDLKVSIREITNQLIGSRRVSDFNEIEKRPIVIRDVLSQINQRSRLFDVSETEDLLSAQNRLKGFAKTVERIRQAIKQVDERDAFEEHFTEVANKARSQLATISREAQLLNRANSCLERLLSPVYKDAFLESINESHKTQLQTIFSYIHSPREFDSISLGRHISLKRSTGTASEISEISTGQRAALAMSIFLSLNSSVVEKAPWLLFDDPVAHTDDLNILSFLDILRDLVIDGRRQLFFATANAKIADLFSKKFDFLGNKFKQFSLQR